MGVIYKITSPTGRLYIGKTKHLGRRINTYKYNMANDAGWKNAKILNSLKKYGWDAHKLEIIEECADELLNEREKYWIKELDTYCFENEKHMNMSRGGEEGGRIWMFDEERRKIQSAKFTGEGNPFYGKKHTEEFKKIKSKEVSEYNKKNGINISEWGAEKGREKVRRKIVCYDLKGHYIKEFNSLSEAEKEMGINHSCISECCTNNTSQAGLFIFRYKEGEVASKIDVGDISFKSVKRSILTLTDTYEIVCEHPSAQEASEFWGIPKTTINRASQYNWLNPIRTGHIFIYTDLYEIIFKEVA